MTPEELKAIEARAMSERVVDDVREQLDACLSRLKGDVRDLDHLVTRERMTNPQPVYPAHDGKPNLRPHTIPGWWQIWSGGICIALLSAEDVAPLRAADGLNRLEREHDKAKASRDEQKKVDALTSGRKDSHCNDTKRACCVRRGNSCLCECAKCVGTRADAVLPDEPPHAGARPPDRSPCPICSAMNSCEHARGQ